MYTIIVQLIFRGMYIVGKDVNAKDELILKVDFASLKTIDNLIDLLKSNDVEVKALGRDEYVVKL